MFTNIPRSPLHPLLPLIFFNAPQLWSSWGGHIALGPSFSPLCLLLFKNYREQLELGTWNFICSISTKNKQTHNFFSVGPSPLCRLCAIKAVAAPPPPPHTHTHTKHTKKYVFFFVFCFFSNLDRTTCSTVCRWLLICMVPHLNICHTALFSTPHPLHTPATKKIRFRF